MASDSYVLVTQREVVKATGLGVVHNLQVSASNEARIGRILAETDAWQDLRHSVYSQERSRIAYAVARAGYACIYGEAHGE